LTFCRDGILFGVSHNREALKYKMTTQHTPGTWKVETCDYALATPPRKELKISNSQCYLATLACDFDMPNNPYTVPLEQAQANARLIAAAPELLAALEDCAGVLESIDKQLRGKSYAITEVLRKSRAAISKATQP